VEIIVGNKELGMLIKGPHGKGEIWELIYRNSRREMSKSKHPLA
jgi:hypothetical protein